MLRWLTTFLILAAGLAALLFALGAHLELGEARELMARGRQVEGVVTEAYISGYSYAYAVGGTRHSAAKRGIPRSLTEKAAARNEDRRVARSRGSAALDHHRRDRRARGLGEPGILSADRSSARRLGGGADAAEEALTMQLWKGIE